jgi:hypothetical protein
MGLNIMASMSPKIHYFPIELHINLPTDPKADGGRGQPDAKEIS